MINGVNLIFWCKYIEYFFGGSLLPGHTLHIYKEKYRTKKMSKSDSSDLSRINLTDNKDQIINKIKKAKTDPLPMPNNSDELKERLEAKNLLGIYSSFTNSTLDKSIKEFDGRNFSDFKEKLTLFSSNVMTSNMVSLMLRSTVFNAKSGVNGSS